MLGGQDVTPMPHVVERAATGRAKCRGCGQPIAKDTWRVGEAVPNLFADGEGAESRHWYHLPCAAIRRPEACLQALDDAAATVPDRERLIETARAGVDHPRLPRLDRVERASSGRAACRACRAPIAKDTWRIALLFWQDGRFVPAGFIHPGCARAYTGTAALADRLRYASPALDEADLAAVVREIEAGAPGTDVADGPD